MILEDILEAIRAVEGQGRICREIELGDHQLHALADQLRGWSRGVAHRMQLGSVVLCPSRRGDARPLAWEELALGQVWLYGVHIQGVEAPDYLAVVSGDPIRWPLDSGAWPPCLGMAR